MWFAIHVEASAAEIVEIVEMFGAVTNLMANMHALTYARQNLNNGNRGKHSN